VIATARPDASACISQCYELATNGPGIGLWRSIAAVHELRPGLWHWETRHPEWEPTEPWSENVSSYAIDDGARLLLFDPLGVPSELLTLAADRDTAIVLTAPWHERDAQLLVERLGAPVFTPLPDSAQYLMDTYGITAEQAGDGSPDLVWLLREQRGDARPYSPGDHLPFGADVFRGHKPNDTVLWVESRRAVISGDTLVDFGQGLEINEGWLRPGVTREDVAGGLRPLLELPVEHVLPTHGGPTDRAALERALA
jgi:glyoxylase-like metal-dependent hydrolase (beta-lactamase superfamily II)